MSVVSDIPERDNLMKNFLIFCLLTFFLPPLYNDPWAFGVGVKNIIQKNYFKYLIPSELCYLYQKKKVICHLIFKEMKAKDKWIQLLSPSWLSLL